MILVALLNNILIDVICTKKYYFLVKFIFSVFFSLNNFNYPKKSWQSHQNLQNSSAPKTRFPEGGYPADIRPPEESSGWGQNLISGGRISPLRRSPPDGFSVTSRMQKRPKTFPLRHFRVEVAEGVLEPSDHLGTHLDRFLFKNRS